MVISALVVPRTIMLLRETGRVLLESTSRGLDLDDVRAHLLELPHVREVHDPHASQIASGLPVLSAHVVVEDTCFHDGRAPGPLAALQQCVADHFRVSVAHSTFQLEPVMHRPHEDPVHPQPRPRAGRVPRVSRSKRLTRAAPSTMLGSTEGEGDRA